MSWDELAKLDAAPTDGLAGVEDSLAYRIEEISKHFHSRARWLGKSGDQSGNDWAADTLTPFQAISGNAVYGADANDEAKVLGTDDTPVLSGKTYAEIDQVLITNVSVDTVYKMRLVYGTGTMADAVTALQYAEFLVKFDATNPQQSAGIPFDVHMPRIAAGTKVWMQTKNATDNATVDFFIGLHEYVG